jgi:hypothetical protein
MDSSQKGQMACVKVQWRAFEKQAVISVPLNPDCRYDMIVDWCGKLYRAQVKYAGRVGTKVQGVTIVGLTKGDRGERRYTSDEIDVLLVYIAALDQICWFGPEIFHGKTALQIRYSPTKNGQKKGCILVEDYVW